MTTEARAIYTDRDGDLIRIGDTVKHGENDSDETVISYGTHRDQYGFGVVVGFYIPDYCKVVKKETIAEHLISTDPEWAEILKD